MTLLRHSDSAGFHWSRQMTNYVHQHTPYVLVNSFIYITLQITSKCILDVAYTLFYSLHNKLYAIIIIKNALK